MALEEKNKPVEQPAVAVDGRDEILLQEIGTIGAWPLPSCNIVHGKLLMDSKEDYSLQITLTEEHPFESVDLLYFADFIIPEAQKRVREFAHWYEKYRKAKQSQDFQKSSMAETERDHKS